MFLGLICIGFIGSYQYYGAAPNLKHLLPVPPTAHRCQLHEQAVTRYRSQFKKESYITSRITVDYSEIIKGLSLDRAR